MRAFVLGTGRCGTMTVATACSHIANFTAAHESQPGKWRDRLEYPDRHIEVDHRLSWFLGSLDRRYGDAAVYVHLTRDPDKTARSWSVRKHRQGQMRTWPPSAFYWPNGWPDGLSTFEAAQIMVRTVTDNIELFLRDKTKVVRMSIEDPHDAFDELWSMIGAEGNLSRAHAALDRVHNAGRQL